jgi:hypothetical protein
MKKIIALAILAGISFSAHAEKMYGAIGLGTSSDYGTAYTIAGGMEVAKVPAGPKITIPIAAEVGYVNFGSEDVYGVSTSASGFFGTAVGSYAINDDLAATVRLGLASIKTKAAVCYAFVGCGTASDTSIGTVVGVGIRYDLKHKAGIPLMVGAEANNYDGSLIVGGRAQLNF